MHLLALFDETLALRLVQSLAHFLWQGCVLAVIAVVAGSALKRATAHVRYSFHVTTLLVMTACMPVTLTLQGDPRQGPLEFHSRGRSPDQSAAGRDGAEFPRAPARNPAGISDRPALSEPTAPNVMILWLASRVNAIHSALTPWAPFLVAAYLLGVGLMMLRLAVALRGGRRLLRSATPVPDPRLPAILGREVRRLGLKTAPAAACWEQISIPIVVGIKRPAILLPAALASGLAPDQLQAILGHELAHILRCDLLVNLFQRFTECLLFFHPAVWFVSRRVSIEREVAADDLVLAAGLARVHYADALVRMAELSSALRNSARCADHGAALAAWGRRESELKRRVLRLVTADNRPVLQLTGAGWALFGSVLVFVMLAPLLVRAWAPPPAMVELPGPASAPAAEQPIVPANPRGPTIIVADHVVVWDNQIMTWDEVVARLRTMRASGPFRAHFFSTNGLLARNGWKEYDDRIMQIYGELFEPVGVSIGSLSAKGSARWDAIRTTDDLRPDPKRARSGQVVTPQGERAHGAQVIVLPAAGPFAAAEVILSETQLRDPYDEQWSSTDELGHFVVHPTDDSYVLAIVHPSGFAIQPGAVKNIVFRLQPWATISFGNKGDVADQQINLSIAPAGARSGQARFAIYSIEPKGKPIEVKVPAGVIIVSRSLAMRKGMSVSLPVEETALKPGETRAFVLNAASDADRKAQKRSSINFRGKAARIVSCSLKWNSLCEKWMSMNPRKRSSINFRGKAARIVSCSLKWNSLCEKWMSVNPTITAICAQNHFTKQLNDIY